MKSPIHRGGRVAQGRISVLKLPISSRPVLGKSEPVEDDRRARAAMQAGPSHANPRKQELATIDEPLPPRLQTALSYRLDPELRARLNGAPGPQPMSRRQADQRVQVTLYIDSELEGGDA
ncbi:hypothetical protein HF690_14660 [Oleiagrimonas citrea]|uniref:Uncharacterized protein n=1 Tax=Oleiagrimonas citrea TaxID=1665687 RepID=A0A846ZRQ8_9GAMM|nr:hypothetical protein [Oleiagrimonas citrea]NKZ40199.1 hypothetical protein [Oleiagrimonas citrea]